MKKSKLDGHNLWPTRAPLELTKMTRTNVTYKGDSCPAGFRITHGSVEGIPRRGYKKFDDVSHNR